MKVLFLTKYPDSQASSRYCVFQYLGYFASRGVDCDASPFYSNADFARVFHGGNALLKVVVFLKCLFRRLKWLLVVHRYDLVVSHRECVPVGPLIFERCLKKMGIPYVFIYDDALFLFKQSSRSRIYDLFKSPDKFLKIFGMANLVIGANDWLAQVAKDHGGNAEALEIGEDLDRYTPRSADYTSEGRICLGWIGSRSTEKYLELIRDSLENVGRAYPETKLLVIGGGRFNLEHVEVIHEPWALDTEVANLHRMDIGLMPLPEDEWSLGKSGGKARLYMSVAVPPVVSAIGYNTLLIEDGVDGVLVQSAGDWENALKEVIESSAKREALARSARSKIERQYSVSSTGERYLSLLQGVLNRRGV